MKTPIAKRRRLVAKWRRSHPQTMTDFARSIGVQQSTFWRWTRDYLEEIPSAAPMAGFVELAAIDPAAVSPTGLEPPVEPVDALSIRLQGPHGIDAVLHFHAPPSSSRLAEMLRGVLGC